MLNHFLFCQKMKLLFYKQFFTPILKYNISYSWVVEIFNFDLSGIAQAIFILSQQSRFFVDFKSEVLIAWRIKIFYYFKKQRKIFPLDKINCSDITVRPRRKFLNSQVALDIVYSKFMINSVFLLTNFQSFIQRRIQQCDNLIFIRLILDKHSDSNSCNQLSPQWKFPFCFWK